MRKTLYFTLAHYLEAMFPRFSSEISGQFITIPTMQSLHKSDNRVPGRSLSIPTSLSSILPRLSTQNK